MRIGILGPIDVESDGESLHVGGPQQRRLLGLLVVHRGHAVSTDRIVDVLWDNGDTPAGAARSVRTYMSRLRATLPGAVIDRTAAGYLLDIDAVGATLDVAEFDRLLERAARQPPDLALITYEEALALWRGPPFGEFGDEWWALPDAARLREKRDSAEENRAAALIALGEYRRAIAELERITAQLPHHERPARLLVQALMLADRRAEALRVARAFRTRLVDDTGLDPSSQFDHLEQVVLDGVEAPSVDWPLRGYTLRRLIGRGRHGHVYAAVQPATRREVAIRVIDRDLADDPEFVRRFDAESRLISRLDHPHIAELHDYWREPGNAYLVSRLVPGGSVRDDVEAAGPWSLERVGRLVENLHDALAAVPAEEVTFDLDARNVLLDEEREAFLTDFRIGAVGTTLPDVGVALARLARVTLTGAVPGADGSPEPRSIPETLVEVLDRAEDGTYPDADGFLAAWRTATGRQGTAHRGDGAQVNPYKGLQPFDESDTASFFGREDTVAELLQRVERDCFVAVIGPSGAGKSSVVRAGLTPRLRSDGAAVVTMTPGDDPMEALRDTIGTVATAEDRADTGIVHEVAHLTCTLGRLVIVVDQFEECWTRCPDDVRWRFLDLLATLVADTDVRVVATLRSDLLDQPLADPRIGGMVGAGAIVLGAMSAQQLRDVVVQPADECGVGFGDGVADELVAAAVGQPGFLPLLQFTLTELFEHRDDTLITAATLTEVGGIAGAIGRRAEDSYRTLDSAGQRDARELFGRLVVPGDGAPDTRRRTRRSELPPELAEVAEHFVAARMLMVDREPHSREPTFEVAHEALFDSWSRLRGWIDEDRAWLLQRQHLEQAAAQWNDAGRPDSELYRGVRLESAIEALESHGDSVSPLSASFIEAGRHLRDAELDAERRRVKRLRTTAAVTSALALIAVLLGVLALRQRDEARAAEDTAANATRDAQNEARLARAAEDTAADATRDAQNEARLARAAESAAAAAGRDAAIEALVGRSESLRATQRDVAALLAVEALRLEDSARTRSALFATFTDDERFLDARRFDEGGGRAGILVPGRGAFITDANGRVHAYDLDTGELADPLPALGTEDRDTLPLLVASSDGRLLLQATRDDVRVGPSTVGVMDLDRAEFHLEPVTVDGAITSAAFLPDGRIALATGEDGAVTVVDGERGTTVAAIAGLDVPPDEIVWTAAPGSAATAQALRRPSGVAVDGNTMFVGSADGSVRVIGLPGLEVLSTLRLPPETTSNLVPVGATLIASGRQGASRVRIDDGSVLWSIDGLDSCSRLLVVTERGSVFCGGWFGRIDELDLETGRLLRRLDAQTGIRASLWVTADGSELVRFDESDPVVSRWRIDGSGPIIEVTPSDFAPIAFEPSGERLMLHSGDVWEGTFSAGIIGVDDPDELVAVPGLLVPSWSGDDELFGGAVAPVGGIQFAHADLRGDDTEVTTTGVAVPDVQYISGVSLETGKQRSLVRWLADDGRTWLRTVDPDSVAVGARVDVANMITWSIDRAGDRIVAGTSDGIRIHDGETGELVAELGDSQRRSATVTVADQLLIGSLDGTITLHDLDSLDPIQTLNDGRGLMLAASSTGDGGLIAVATGNSSVSVYDSATGIRVGDPIPIPADATDAFHIPRLALDGSVLAVRSGYDARIDTTELWDLDPARWIEAACALAGRNLTPGEWDTHVGDLEPYRTTCPDVADGS